MFSSVKFGESPAGLATQTTAIFFIICCYKEPIQVSKMTSIITGFIDQLLVFLCVMDVLCGQCKLKVGCHVVHKASHFRTRDKRG